MLLYAGDSGSTVLIRDTENMFTWMSGYVYACACVCICVYVYRYICIHRCIYAYVFIPCCVMDVCYMVGHIIISPKTGCRCPAASKQQGISRHSIEFTNTGNQKLHNCDAISFWIHVHTFVYDKSVSHILPYCYVVQCRWPADGLQPCSSRPSADLLLNLQ